MFKKTNNIHEDAVQQYLRWTDDVGFTLTVSSADSMYNEAYFILRKLMYVNPIKPPSTKKFWRRQIRLWNTRFYHDVRYIDSKGQVNYFHIQNGVHSSGIKMKLKQLI